MKIALIITAQQEQQFAEIMQFLRVSELEKEVCEIWLMAGEPPLMAENILEALEKRYQETPPDLLLFASGVRGNELATRLAARLTGEAFCGATCGVLYDESSKQPQFLRPVYGNAMVGRFSAGAKPWCVSVARTSRSFASQVSFPQITLPVSAKLPAWLVNVQQRETIQRPLLNQARCVVVAGQGVASAQNMERVKELAQKLGAQTGASRQVVMNAWCEMDRLIGMSGALIAPEICIVAGVSGASAFSVGIRESTLIIAINNDPDAAIFNQADVIIVEEMMPMLEALAQCAASN